MNATVTRTASFSVIGVEVRVQVLSDGQKVVDASCYRDLLIALGSRGLTLSHLDEQMQAFDAWMKGIGA